MYEEICELQYLCIYFAHNQIMCKPCVGATLVRFQALIAHAFLARSIPFCATNRQVYQDQYVENRFHVSQDLVR